MSNGEKFINEPRRLYVPNVVDIEVTGRCDFNCPDCWGTKPCNYQKELTLKQWLRIFERIDNYSFFDSNDRVNITGGEPLLRKDLDLLINGLIENGNRQVSLSTTGLDYYNILPKILNKLMSIGIPIDGATPEINSSWRSHVNMSDGGLKTSIIALQLIQQLVPDLQTSVRTIIHPGNINEISNIPLFLDKSGIDISRLRWILYELTQRVSPTDAYSRLISKKSIESFVGGKESFVSTVEYAGRDFNEVIIRTIGAMAYRNFIISPCGETRAVVPSDNCDELIEIEFGNINKNFKDTMSIFNDSNEKYFFSYDAADSPAGFYARQNVGL